MGFASDRKVNKGEPFGFPAQFFNDLQDMRSDWRRWLTKGNVNKVSGPSPSPHTVQVELSAAQSQFKPVWLTSAIDNTYGDDFKNYYIANATNAGGPAANMAILQEGGVSNDILNAVISGVSVAIVDIQDVGHARCTPQGSGLVSSTSGEFAILFKEGGTGEKLCLINVTPTEVITGIALTGSTGIPGATKTATDVSWGNATCKLLTVEDSGASLVNGTTDVEVYSSVQTDVQGDTIIQVKKIAGLWFVDVEDCEDEQGIGAAGMVNPTAGADLGAGYNHLTLFDSELLPAKNVTIDLVNDQFSFDKAGLWELSWQLFFNHNSSNSGRRTNLRLWDVTDNSQIAGDVPLGIGRNVEDSDTSSSFRFQLDASDVGHPIRLELGGGDVVTSVTYEIFRLDLLRLA